MSRKILFCLTLVVFVTTGAAVFGQDSTPTDPNAPRTFKLQREGTSQAGDLDLGEEEIEIWDPTLRAGEIEVSLGVGFMGLNSVLLQHEQMIYKFTTESTFWGDVELNGESAFAPAVRIGYGLSDWASLEWWSGVSFSNYTSTITNRRSRKNEPNALVVEDPALGEFDAETRSLITLQAGINAVVYPLAVGGESGGRWHPYLTGGVGNMWYSVNSNFVDGTASALDLNFGGGMRVLADRNISLRLEVVMHRNDLEWTPAEYFKKLNEGTTLVPLNEYPVQTGGSFLERPIKSFATNTMNILQWTIGVQGSF